MTQRACCDQSIAPAAPTYKPWFEPRWCEAGARRIIPGMKVRQRDRTQLLGQVPLFSYCSQRELAKVAKLANELELPAGHTLIHEDAEVAYSFFVLVDGEADVRRRNRRVATLGPGDSFGELALILRRPRTATVTLTAPSQLLSISAHNFRPLLMTSPEIQFKLLEALAERLAPSTT